MRASQLLRPLLLAGLIAGSLVASGAAQEATPSAVVEDPEARYPAHVHAGTCAEPGEVVFTLQDAGYGRPITLGDTAATPEAIEAIVVGPDIANAAAVSVSTISTPIDQLVASPHAIDVHVGVEVADGRLTCGEIGGFRTAGDLVFGVGHAGDSDYAGMAWLHDNGDGTTTVAVFVASGLTRDELRDPGA